MTSSACAGKVVYVGDSNPPGKSSARYRPDALM